MYFRGIKAMNLQRRLYRRYQQGGGTSKIALHNLKLKIKKVI
jgi:hypothetical protein